MNKLLHMQDFLQWQTVGALICLAVIAGVYNGNLATVVLSIVLDKYLQWKYPIRSSNDKQNLPTCPYQWPNGQGDVAKFLEGIERRDEWEKKHGKIYRIWSGMNSEVVLTQPQQLQLVFKDSHEHFKAENNNSGYLMSELLGQCVGLISREHWRPLRTIMEVPFQHHKMTTHVEMVLRHTTQHFSSLQESGNLRLGYIHPTSDLKMLPFWIVAEIFYGPCDLKMRAELEQLSQMREQIWKSMIQGGLVRWSWSKYLPTKVNRTLREFQQRWRSFNQYAYQRALRDNPNLPIVTMMDSVRSENVSLEQIHQTIDEALFANLDVTTGGTSWNVVFLAAHPGVQKRLRAEAMAATDIRAYLLSTSTFLSACISESARLKPLAAFSVPQSAPVDRIVGGFLIPARTNFVVDTYALNIKNEFWGPDRQQYRPDRFLEHRPTDLRYQFWRFGFGPRQCMGRYVADLAIRAMMTHLILHYELDWFGGSIEDNSKWARDLESWITLPDMLVNCKAT